MNKIRCTVCNSTTSSQSFSTIFEIWSSGSEERGWELKKSVGYISNASLNSSFSTTLEELYKNLGL